MIGRFVRGRLNLPMVVGRSHGTKTIGLRKQKQVSSDNIRAAGAIAVARACTVAMSKCEGEP
jgi:hypothetical protein